MHIIGYATNVFDESGMVVLEKLDGVFYFRNVTINTDPWEMANLSKVNIRLTAKTIGQMFLICAAIAKWHCVTMY